MDSDSRFGNGGRYSPMDTEAGTGSSTRVVSAANMSSGAKKLATVGCVLAVLIVLMLVMSFINTGSTIAHRAEDASLSERLATLVGFYKAIAVPRYTFIRAYDSKTLQPIIDARDLIEGLPSGAPPSIVKGWIELLYGTDADTGRADSAVNYNISVVHPDKAVTRGVTAFELVVVQFTMRSETPMEKAAVALCGGSSGVQCAAANTVVVRKDIYTGSGLLPPNFATVATADALHTTFLLLVYMGNSTVATTLSQEDVKFVIELER